IRSYFAGGGAAGGAGPESRARAAGQRQLFEADQVVAVDVSRSLDSRAGDLQLRVRLDRQRAGPERDSRAFQRTGAEGGREPFVWTRAAEFGGAARVEEGALFFAYFDAAPEFVDGPVHELVGGGDGARGNRVGHGDVHEPFAGRHGGTDGVAAGQAHAGGGDRSEMHGRDRVEIRP